MGPKLPSMLLQQSGDTCFMFLYATMPHWLWPVWKGLNGLLCLYVLIVHSQFPCREDGESFFALRGAEGSFKGVWNMKSFPGARMQHGMIHQEMFHFDLTALCGPRMPDSLTFALEDA